MLRVPLIIAGQSQRRKFASPCQIHPADTGRAAELRAAAAERRLANLAGPSNLVQMDPDSDEDIKGDFDEEEHSDVKDPHIDSDERRRDMEAEMNEDERRDLRGGWEDFVKVEPGEPGTSRPPKRRMEEDPQQSRPSKDMSKPTFGNDMVERERLKGIGMVQTTLSNTSKTVGSRREAVNGVEAEEVKPLLDKSQWECKLCTYVNIADHGRCGRSQ
jgi:hypothetical protein